MRTLLTREAVAQRFNLKSQLTANSSQRNINSVWQYHPGAIAKSTPTKMETTKRTAAETTPSNNHTSSPNHLSNSNDKSLLVKQQKDIDYVIKKVRYLEGKISELKGCLFFTQQVNSLSAAKIDCQEHYSRRPCFVISRTWWWHKRKSHKMLNHTQTICLHQPTNCLSVFDHFKVYWNSGKRKRNQQIHHVFRRYEEYRQNLSHR